jgi:hypothetical protein
METIFDLVAQQNTSETAAEPKPTVLSHIQKNEGTPKTL